MKFLIYYTLGFALPGLGVLSLLVIGHMSNDWSGYSPLNGWPAVPAAYLVYLVVGLLTVAVLRKSLRRPNYILLSGLVGGLPLFMFVRPIASVFRGWWHVGFTIVGAGAFVATAIWLASREPTDCPSAGGA